MTGATITRKMTYALNEKDVENLYRQFLSISDKDMIFTSPYGCDGFGVSQKSKIRVLCEFKDDLDLHNRYSQCKILSQSIYYVKKFDLDGKKRPTTIFVGDRNEWFVIHVNDIHKYLSMDYDWSIPPSQAYTNTELMNQLMVDDDIKPFVGDIENIQEAVDKIKNLTNEVVRLVPINQQNILNVFNHFEKKVIVSKELTPNQSVNLFIQILINPIDNYLHPYKGRKKLVTKSFGEVSLQGRDKYESFFSHFSNTYTPKEKEVLTSILDRLIEEVIRRKQGEFFTPTIWVDKSYEYTTSVLGDDWKEKYVVWDPAWGTGNLTRDYKFKELYCSTLNQSDIDTANQMGYNPEAVKFQFDFLNDPYEKLPEGLRKAIEEGRNIFVLMNPPYATANVMGNNSEHKEGVAKTVMNELMIGEGWGKSSQNLYSQFFYRITKFQEINKKIKIGVFCKPLYLTGDAYGEFREKFLNYFGFEKGFLFEAGHFSDVSEQWGINFAIFSENKNDIKTNFIHDLIDINQDDLNLKVYGIKNLYNTDGLIQASKWVREEIKNLKTFDAPQISSATVVKQKGIGTIVQNHFGYFYNNSNNVSKNNQSVGLFSSCCSAAHGLSVISENIFKCINLFSARKIMTGSFSNWINDKDEYFAPNENHPQYQQYTYDSVVYSLFNNSSQQSSLRQVTYKEKLWDIKNEFFWMSKEEMLNLAETNHYDNLYNDARTSEDRYVHKVLFGEENFYNQLSPDAKEVLDTATNLVRTSIQQRKLMSEGFPEYHLDSWDAGYAQLKLVWKEYLPNEFKEFRDKYKRLEDRMRPLVYELGFLLK
jgi:hypothetical protein